MHWGVNLILSYRVGAVATKPDDEEPARRDRHFVETGRWPPPNARKMMEIYNLGTCFWEYDMYIRILASMIEYRRTIHSIHLHTSGKFEIFLFGL